MPELTPRLALSAEEKRTAFMAYGCTIGVQVDDPKLLKLITNHLPYGWKPSDAKTLERLYSFVASGRKKNRKLRRPHTLFRGTELLARSLELRDILEIFEQDTRMFVAEHARRRIFVHAAVVGWKGRAILIPGESMSGKTSLAAELIRAGANYYSDEYAVLDEKGRVHPYAKPLSIRKPGDTSYRQTDHAVEAFGGTAGRRPLRVGLVLVTSYRRGARWRPRALSPGMGVLSMLANAVPARRKPEKTLDVLRTALSGASIVNGVRGEACEVVASVLQASERTSNSGFTRRLERK